MGSSVKCEDIAALKQTIATISQSVDETIRLYKRGLEKLNGQEGLGKNISKAIATMQEIHDSTVQAQSSFDAFFNTVIIQTERMDEMQNDSVFD